MTNTAHTPLWISGPGVAENMDVTGLNGADGRNLGRIVAAWNLRDVVTYTPVYNWRNGKRYMNTLNLRVDLNHPVMAPFRDDILAAAADPQSAREFDHVDGFMAIEDWAAGEFADEYAEHCRAQAEDGWTGYYAE